MRVKEESGKAGLKLNIQNSKLMVSDPIASWQIDGEKVETVTHFLFLCSRITVDGDCSWEIKRRLLFGRKAMTNLEGDLKSGDITLLTKVHVVKAMDFPSLGKFVWIWKLDHKEGWVPEELMLLNCGAGEDSWESLGQQGDQINLSLRKSTLNIHWQDWCWSSNILATWCEELTHRKRPWCWERLRVGGEGDDRGWGGWMASPTQ